MKVENENGDTLYHMQSVDLGSDGKPFDVFVWLDHEPREEDLKKAFALEYRDGFDEDEEGFLELQREWLATAEWYAVYAEEL